eukprot:Nitzschia sp. Nitz4//scaffold21_size171442//137522//137944//NITZ4_002185-RA/size171442-processed-gene-0.58-mRNA-1//-1//CDS//3329542483//1542//frame0
MAAPNAGGAMTAEIDEEVAKFRELQEQMQKVRNDLQIVMGQLAENEMVQQELNLLDGGSNVFKMVGPVLIKNSLEDAKDTVSKRIEFISSEKNRLEGKVKELEAKGMAISEKVQRLQQSLQQATHDAVQQIAQQHATTSS